MRLKFPDLPCLQVGLQRRTNPKIAAPGAQKSDNGVVATLEKSEDKTVRAPASPAQVSK